MFHEKTSEEVNLKLESLSFGIFFEHNQIVNKIVIMGQLKERISLAKEHMNTTPFEYKI